MNPKQPRDREGRFDEVPHTPPESSGLDELASIRQFLPDETFKTWKRIASVVPQHAYLAGGTALTVHLRHRISRDLDFFTEGSFDPEAIATSLSQLGKFAPSLATEGTLNGDFEGTKVQFLDAQRLQLLQPTQTFAGLRVSSIEDILANKLKVVGERGALRDYFDIMQIEFRTHLRVETAIPQMFEKYTPIDPQAMLFRTLVGLGYMDDVASDTTLPVSREKIENYWRERSKEIREAVPPDPERWGFSSGS